MKSWIGAVAFAGICGLCACNDDDKYVYPDVQTEFVCLQTDATGTGVKLLTDKGEAYSIQSRSGLDKLSKDTIYRTVSVFQLMPEAKEVKLYSCKAIVSPNPLRPESFKSGVKTDPVEIQSIWLSGNYLNMVLLIPVKEEKHAFHFVDEGLETAADGKKILNLRLYHDSNNDYAAFTNRAYLSVPLHGYKDKLSVGDGVCFHLNTVKQGQVFRKFALEKSID